jgi:hypothetical protein
MTLFHSHPEHVARPVFGRILVAFRILHRAIVSAKLRRLERESISGVDSLGDPDENGATFPQRPVILGDKWDF